MRWLAGPSSGQPIAGAKIVENDDKGGFLFEAAIPWSSFAEARTMRVGLRAAFRYHNAGGAGVIGTGGGSVDHPNDLAALPGPAEQAVVEGLLGPKNLAGTAPHIDVFADVSGDERKERISVFGKFFTICGPGYRGGKQFFWREVQGELSSFETRELTGRGKDDMIVRRRVNNSGVIHEMLEVWTVATAGDEPVTIFTQEISISDKQHRVANAVRISGKEIEVSVEPAQGWDASSFKEPTNGDEGILLPWATVKARTFHLEKGRFVKASEVAQPGSGAPAMAAASHCSRPCSRRRRGACGSVRRNSRSARARPTNLREQHFGRDALGALTLALAQLRHHLERHRHRDRDAAEGTGFRMRRVRRAAVRHVHSRKSDSARCERDRCAFPQVFTSSCIRG